jgi:transcriptional regulator with XRE-family HTH domain
MTQGDLAIASGVGRATIARLETGSVGQPHMGTITALATALEVPPTELVGDPAEIWAIRTVRRSQQSGGRV